MPNNSILVSMLAVLLLFATGCHKEADSYIPAATAPVPPVITYPPANSSQSNCVFIQWQPVSSIQHYTLQIAADTVFSVGGSLVFEGRLNSISTDYLVNIPVSGYYWARLLAENEAGVSAWSNLLPFAVDAANPVNCTDTELIHPQLLLPLHNAQLTGTEQTFTWQKVPAALHYQLQIADNNSFSGLMYNNPNISQPFRTVQNFNMGTFYWRVKSVNNYAASNWSETRQFTIVH